MSHISADSIFLIFSKIFEKKTQMNSPNKIPQMSILKKDSTPTLIDHPVMCHSKIIPSITRNNAREVPSLNILSHSKISASRRGAPTLLKIERTATGSVEEMRAPKRRHIRKFISKPRRGKVKYNTVDTITAENTTQTIARLHIVFQLRRSSL